MWKSSKAKKGKGPSYFGGKKHSATSREVLIIRETLNDATKRKLIISELEGNNVTEANLLRFYQAIREFRSLSQKSGNVAPQRTGLGRKIISMFVQSGGLYEVQGLKSSLRQSLLRLSRFSPTAFDEAYVEISSILESSDKIVRLAQKIGVIHSTIFQAIKILSIVEDETRRQMLIQELVEENLEEAMELRFFQACKSFQAENDPRKRSAMGKKIISMFIEAGSLHELKSLSETTRKKLLAVQKFTKSTFDEAKEEVLNILETSSNIVKIASKVGVVESSILALSRGAGTSSATTISLEVFERMMNNPLLSKEFESFVRDEFIDELWKFRAAVIEWKSHWDDSSAEEIRLEAVSIYENMIRAESPDEINISGTMKEHINAKLHNAIEFNLECPLDLFDEALREVTKVLHQNINYRVMNAVKAATTTTTMMGEKESPSAASSSSNRNLGGFFTANRTRSASS